MDIKCFLLEPTDRVQESLRRYAPSAKCTVSGYGYHNASTVTGNRGAKIGDSCGDRVAHDDPRWPQTCKCGYQFTVTDQWQSRVDSLYRRTDTGDLMLLSDAPAGAMWFAPWMEDRLDYKGPDGRTLVVKIPGNHSWVVDARASNCDSPCVNCSHPYHVHSGGLCVGAPAGVPFDKSHYYKDARPHKCWVRHGEAPNIHVDKNGLTCGAGAGSIATPAYHGFLHNGHLTNC